MSAEQLNKRNRRVFAGLFTLVFLALALVALVGYAESRFEHMGERQALAFTKQAGDYVGGLMKAGVSEQDSAEQAGGVLVFDADTGIISSVPQRYQDLVSEGSSLYDLAEGAFTSLVSRSTGSTATVSAHERVADDLETMRAAIDNDESAVYTVPMFGSDSYLAVAPTGIGSLYVCGIIDADRALGEVSAMTIVFTAIFVLCAVCVAVAAVVITLLYRKQARDHEAITKTHLYEALSDSLDFAVNLYSPADRQTTPIVAKGMEIFGVTFDELINDPAVPDALHLSAEGRQLVSNMRNGLIASIESGEFSFRGAVRGSVCYVAYTVRPLYYEGKNQLLVTVRDVTKDKVMQLSMIDAMESAEAANRAKSEFLSRMSHEIRTPMNVILGMLEIARHNMDDRERLEENLAHIEHASGHLLELINEVLDISKIESGKVGFNQEPFCLKDVVKSLRDVIEPQCREKGQTYTCTMRGFVDEYFIGDAMRVRQMLVNLLTNAVKYTNPGGHVSLEVAVDTAFSPRYRRITFVVADDGIGMRPDYLDRLFEPFVMEGRSDAQGTGLGMPIVRNIVNAMGGDIHVETAENEGTTFTIVANKRLADGPGAEQASNALPLDPEHALEGVRVLLVEDNDLNAEIASELLAMEGLVVERAENGAEGLRMFEVSDEGFYDVVLMDVRMPVMNGYEATRAIRALDRPDAQAVPIVAMSANAFADDVLASLKSGMNAHLSKPIDMATVRATLARELGRG